MRNAAGLSPVGLVVSAGRFTPAGWYRRKSGLFTAAAAGCACDKSSRGSRNSKPVNEPVEDPRRFAVSRLDIGKTSNACADQYTKYKGGRLPSAAAGFHFRLSTTAPALYERFRVCPRKSRLLALKITVPT